MRNLPHWLVALIVALIAVVAAAIGLWADSKFVWVLISVGIVVFLVFNWINPSYWHRRVTGGLLVTAWGCNWIAALVLKASLNAPDGKFDVYVKAATDSGSNIAFIFVIAILFLPGEFGLLVDKFHAMGLLKTTSETTTKDSFLKHLAEKLGSKDRAKVTFQVLQATYGLFPVDTSKNELTPESAKIALAQVNVAYMNERNRLLSNTFIVGLILVALVVIGFSFAYSGSKESNPPPYKYETVKKFAADELVDSIIKDASVGESRVETGNYCEALKGDSVRISIVLKNSSETYGKMSMVTAEYPSDSTPPIRFTLTLVVEFAGVVKVHRGDELVIEGKVAQINSSSRETLTVYITKATAKRVE